MSKKILIAEDEAFIADLCKSPLNFRHIGGIVVFTSGISRELDQGVLASSITSGARLHWYHNDAVN